MIYDGRDYYGLYEEKLKDSYYAYKKALEDPLATEEVVLALRRVYERDAENFRRARYDYFIYHDRYIKEEDGE